MSKSGRKQRSVILLHIIILQLLSTTWQILYKHCSSDCNRLIMSVIYITGVWKSKSDDLNRWNQQSLKGAIHTSPIQTSNLTVSLYQHNSKTNATSQLIVMEAIRVDRWHFFRGTCFSHLDWCVAVESLFLLLTLKSTATLWSYYRQREPDPQWIHSLDAKTCSQSNHSPTAYQGGGFTQPLMASYEV